MFSCALYKADGIKKRTAWYLSIQPIILLKVYEYFNKLLLFLTFYFLFQ